MTASQFPHDGPPEPAAAGLDPALLAHAIGLFTAQPARGDFPGGQLAVRRRGRLAADVAVGLARGLPSGEAPRAAAPQTRFNVHSVSKPLIALAVAALEEAFGDRATDVAVAIVTNGNAGPGDLFRRFRPLAQLLRRAASQAR